jgi:serine/threonine protein kinase
MSHQDTDTIDRDPGTGIVIDAGVCPARTPLQPGDPARVGGYRLTARLGAGGMGVVYLGVAGDGRVVAVKVMRPELADDPEFRARFGREVATASRVRGARTVRVIDSGTDARGPFLVTEYAAGPSLASLVEAAGPLGAGALCGLAAGLAEALNVIHTAGVVHRDLKPSNVIMTIDGPKVIDFGIAQVQDSISLTRAGTTVGSVAFMAPEQIDGQVGPAADIFSWAVTVAYAASGQYPFGSGPTDAVKYRIRHAWPDTTAVPGALRPMVDAALAKRPQDRPAAHEIIDQLAAPSAPAALAHAADSGPMPTVLSADRPPAAQLGHQLSPVSERYTESFPRSVPGSAGSGRERRAGRRRAGRRTAVAVSAAGLAAATVAGLVLGVGHGTHAASHGASSRPAATMATYPGQLSRGVFQTISRITSFGDTIVATGEQTSDGVVRQQFLVSTNGGASWRVAPVQAAGGGQAPLGFPAVRLAGGPRGWLAVGAQSTWTSRNGQSWTLAAGHGITPMLPGDQMWVLNSTSDGFLAAGTGTGAHGGTQAVIWTSRNGLTWQRMTAAQLGLAGPGETVQSIKYVTSFGDDTVIAGPLSNGQTGAWLSSDGGSVWTPVSVPADHGAGAGLAGLGFDASGLIAVRPGVSPTGEADGVAYFSPNGQSWRYAGTIAAAGGWTPSLVKGSDDGFVVAGTAGDENLVAFTSTGTGTTWQSTASLGYSGDESLNGATVGANTAIVVGSATATATGQQPVFLKATAGGGIQPVSLASIPGAVVPEVTVKNMAVADGQQVAVGSADGYPAIWHKALRGGSWKLVSSLSLVSPAQPGLAALSSVTHGPDGWLAVGANGANAPVVYTSANGVTWRRAATVAADLADVNGTVVGVSAAAGPAGYAIVGKVKEPNGGCLADVWWSPNLITWTRAHDENDTGGSSQVLSIASLPHGFVSVGSHNGQPAVWTTVNGTAWTTTVLPLPSGTQGAFAQVAVHGDEVFALGGQFKGNVTTPLAEISLDGGWFWQQVPFRVPGTVTAVTADAGGFAVAAQSGSQAAVWTSGNGTTWTPAAARGLSGTGAKQIMALAPAGSTVTGFGSVATQQSWQPVTLSVLVR